MNGRSLFAFLNDLVPPSLALPGDRVGYIGIADPVDLRIDRILVLMDYIPECGSASIDFQNYDLVVLHHPPCESPPIPAFVIHSNWDLVTGGACDALADCLNIQPSDVLDPATGVGLIGTIRDGPLPISRFLKYVMRSLKIDNLRVVNYGRHRIISRVGIVPGFGLNPDLIAVAADRDIDLYLSGDLTHKGAISAIGSGLTLVDATHYATELPGLKALGEILAMTGASVTVYNTGVPEGIISDYYRPISCKGINSYQRFPVINGY